MASQGLLGGMFGGGCGGQHTGGYYGQQRGGYYGQQVGGRRLTREELLDRSAGWRAEVAAQKGPGVSLKEAMQAASAARRVANPNYQSVAERREGARKGRSAGAVMDKCIQNGVFLPGRSGKCPGAYNRTPAPYGATVGRSKRRLTAAAAAAVLREYYRQVGEANGGTPKAMKNATKWMRSDTSRLSAKNMPACPTKPKSVTYNKGKLAGRTITRNVIDMSKVKGSGCERNYVFRRRGAVGSRNPWDIIGVDAGEGKASPAYGKRSLRVHKAFKSRVAA